MAFTHILRTKKVRGFAFPVIIHNEQYCLTDLQVFADGMIHCGEVLELQSFKELLSSERVVTEMPESAALSIHGIGELRFAEASWQQTPDSLVALIEEAIARLNPGEENLHDSPGGGVLDEAERDGGACPWKPTQSISPLLEGQCGRGVTCFQITDAGLHLVKADIFPDETARVTGAPWGETEEPYAEFAEHLRDRDYYMLPREGDHVVIDQVGAITVRGWDAIVDQAAYVAAIIDEHEQLMNRPRFVRTCVDAYLAYVQKPTRDSLDALRDCYEAVPEHLRTYCGNRHVSDIPIRMILYGQSEIENWYPYRMAVAENRMPPMLEIPDPPID